MKLKFLVFYIFFTSILSAQNFKKCNTTYIMNQEINNCEDYRIARENIIHENKNWISNNKNLKRSTLQIPVVVHIIHRQSHSLGQGTNIPDYQVLDALRILNEDYSKTNPEFPNPPRNTFTNFAANPNLEFCLATVDESGNPTNGITRTSTSKTNFDPDSEGNDMKRNSTGGKNGWDPSKYLNIWICDLSTTSGGGMVLGYAYLPGLPSWNAWRDGLVVDFQYFGTIGIAAPSSDGRTATHEIGHYLGLNHTFAEQGSGWGSDPCTDSQGNIQCCDNDQANVDDTPPTDGVYWNLVNNFMPPVSSNSYNSCNDLQYGFSSDSPDMHENYMSYAANTWMFTSDQVNVMYATLNGYRSSLKNSNISMNCSGTLSIDELLIKNISIYPNPSKGELNVVSEYDINRICIKNMINQNVLILNNPYDTKINISNLENGMYFIYVNTEIGILSKKILLIQ
tara:strand:- start:10689 stop:12047 length:1359 start_codon:yes stop_codon:yes gene_type:complete